jgi:hypothetical protein
MSWKRNLQLGLALWLGGAAAASAQAPAAPEVPQLINVLQPPTEPAPGAEQPGGASTGETRAAEQAAETGADAGGSKYGPTPLTDVKILQNLLTGDCEKPSIRIAAWVDVDYTYRSTGSGLNNIAPVMNRFGNEFLNRSDGIYLWKPLDEKDWSWGFNAIFIAGSDASFLTPLAGGWRNPDPRFGSDFTDLNLTFHLPILTEGGVDIKAGRQTTVLGPMGALPWQRYFDSSDYAWYRLEEGRYTGVSANWHVNKQLSIYSGIEVGGWGVFFDDPSRNINYIGQVNYWLDCEAKTTKVWATILTGPTGFFEHAGNTTAWEFGLQHNFSDEFWIIVDTQGNYSKASIFGNPDPPGYQERAYDVYTYAGYHLNCELDLNGRLEWYKDVDGGGYPGGFGTPPGPNNYYAATVGVDYHPVKWLQIRPEIRWDHADHPAFGADLNKRDQLSIAADALFKF